MKTLWICHRCFVTEARLPADQQAFAPWLPLALEGKCERCNSPGVISHAVKIAATRLLDGHLQQELITGTAYARRP
jgi:hypothetical protein